MDIRSYTHVRQNLARVMDEVCKSRAPLIISRQNADPVVMMSLDEYNAMEETCHLLRSPRNAKRLLQSMAHADAGKLERHELIEK